MTDEGPALPEYQCKPLLRLEKSITMQIPNNHPGAPMAPCKFQEVNPESLREFNRQIYDPMTPDAHPAEGEAIWSGDFECGNLGPVYQIGPRRYEIHILPDPNDQQTAQWFFFKVENIKPGEYTFIIAGFFRDAQLHGRGAQICSYSEAATRKGIGWQRIGTDMNFFKWKTGKFPEWALSFKFVVEELDTMFFSHLYPYTFTDMLNCLGKLQPLCRPSTLCKSIGGIDVPIIFWDAEEQKCVDIEPLMAQKGTIVHEPPPIRVEAISEFSQRIVELLRAWGREELPDGIKSNRKPVIVLAARTHPGETNSSHAIDGLMQTLFARNDFGLMLRKNFSWLLIPMVNPDGVVCGFYRPSLSGHDINRVWQNPDPMMHPIPNAILDLITVLQRTRPIPFFLDFHGHTAACNSFVYGFMNENNPDLYNAEKVFPLLMTKYSPIFSNEMCSYLKQECYEGTMRVVIRRRFQILFAYTLEMSFGGCDFGSRHDTQFTPHDFRAIGDATAHVITEMFLQPNTLAAREVMALAPPPEPKKVVGMPDVPAESVIEGEAVESRPQFFMFLPRSLKLEPPPKVRLVLKQAIRDVEMP